MKQSTVISGLDVHVYTTSKFATSTKPILAIFALHGRLGSSEEISTQNLILALVDGAEKHEGEKDLMVVAFDHRNHGTRLRNKTANLVFQENPNHASVVHAYLQCGSTYAMQA
ncbi:hypothetical protein K438DRAFT_432410 [Mycena galopus ATCC 62051]|nr:hypothetical protein K438DRAFT_432410 [Mycena galopus ATCC 62051]